MSDADEYNDNDNYGTLIQGLSGYTLNYNLCLLAE